MRCGPASTPSGSRWTPPWCGSAPRTRRGGTAPTSPGMGIVKNRNGKAGGRSNDGRLAMVDRAGRCGRARDREPRAARGAAARGDASGGGAARARRAARRGAGARCRHDCGVAKTGCLRRLPADRDAELERVPAERRSEEHTSELQSLAYLVCRLLLEKKKKDGRKSCAYRGGGPG